MSTVCVLGEGAFGTAVAMVLARNGHRVQLWCYYEHAAQSITSQRCNPLFLPEVQLSNHIVPYINSADAVKGAEYIIEAIPVKYLRSVIQGVQPHVTDSQVWVMLSKGIENETLLFPRQMVHEVIGESALCSVIAGPSFAKELAMGELTGVMVASDNIDIQKGVKKLFEYDSLILYPTEDVVGVEVAAALKNVIALAVGILETVTESQNTKSLLITKALHEIAFCIESLGGNSKTAYSLAGVGDLLGSTFGDKSRNLDVGRKFGQGQSLEDIITQTGYIPEGINTVQSMYQLSVQKNINMPICSAVYRVLFEKASHELLLDAVL